MAVRLAEAHLEVGGCCSHWSLQGRPAAATSDTLGLRGSGVEEDLVSGRFWSLGGSVLWEILVSGRFWCYETLGVCGDSGVLDYRLAQSLWVSLHWQQSAADEGRRRKGDSSGL